MIVDDMNREASDQQTNKCIRAIVTPSRFESRSILANNSMSDSASEQKYWVNSRNFFSLIKSVVSVLDSNHLAPSN